MCDYLLTDLLDCVDSLCDSFSQLLSQTLVSVPESFILALIVALIIGRMTGLGLGGHENRFDSGVILFLVFLCADAVSMYIGHVAPDLISAICIATGIFGVMTMVMGFIILPSAMPVW